MIKPDFIKKMRKKREYTQGYVAKKLNLSRPTYVSIEAGERELNVSEAEKLAKLFDMELCDLLESKDPDYAVEVVKEKSSKYEKSPKLEIRVEEKHMDKFKDVLLYMLEKVGAKPNVGETVIYKLLYFIDFDYYEKYEENLIGATYIKNHHGPTPVEFKTIVDEMEKDEELVRVKSKYFQYEQKKYLPNRRPDLTRLNAREIEHINNVLDRLADRSAVELSSYSHGDIPWQSAEDGKAINYESVFYRNDKYSVKEYEDEL